MTTSEDFYIKYNAEKDENRRNAILQDYLFELVIFPGPLEKVLESINPTPHNRSPQIVPTKLYQKGIFLYSPFTSSNSINYTRLKVDAPWDPEMMLNAGVDGLVDAHMTMTLNGKGYYGTPFKLEKTGNVL